MTNKEYKQAREKAQSADELFTFEKYGGGFYPSRYMDTEDKRELRAEYKSAKTTDEAFAIEGFNGRALVIPTNTGHILKSYYTEVAEIRNGEFIRLWDGFSVTTLKHINLFRSHFGFNTIGKREWIEMPVE